MLKPINRRSFLKNGLGAACAAIYGLPRSACAASPASRFPQWHETGDSFSFAIIADPQVGHADDRNPVAVNARETLALAVREINAVRPKPAFVVFLGDLVNVFDDASVATFEACLRDLEPQPVLVHGNHDTRPPYTAFRQLMRRWCGFQEVFYSFDAGRWHFVVLPCNLSGLNADQREIEMAMLQWLGTDLAANKNKPVAVFEHYHLLPQGLTQLEWYTFPLNLRLKLLEQIAKFGNVRFVFNGHVHNGLQTLLKTSWRYRGTDFVNVPTIIAPRNFGEEFTPFQRGTEKGGYYLIANADNKDLTLDGHLAGQTQVFHYPRRLRRFHNAMEPRWFQRTTEFFPNKRLLNGDFQRGLHAWQPCYRYQTDKDPGFVWKTCSKNGRQAAHILTRAKEPLFWANDEMMELYQTVALPPGEAAVLDAACYLEEPPRNGGGYLRLNAMTGDRFLFMMMFKWGENEHKADNLVRSFGYALTGTAHPWTFLQDLAQQRKGFFWNIPAPIGRWQHLRANIPMLYDSALKQPGAFATLGATKLFLAIGTWVNRSPEAASGAYFADITLNNRPGCGSCVDDRPLEAGEDVFKVEFGLDLARRTRKKRNAQ